MPGAGSGISNCRQQFIRGQRRGIDALEEIRRGNPALPAQAADHQRRVERKHAGGQLGGGIGMSQIAADGAAIAYGRMRDLRRRLAQKWQRFGNVLRTEQIHMAGECADHDLVARDRNAAQLREPPDVDEDGRPGKTQIERGHQALAA